MATQNTEQFISALLDDMQRNAYASVIAVGITHDNDVIFYRTDGDALASIGALTLAAHAMAQEMKPGAKQ